MADSSTDQASTRIEPRSDPESAAAALRFARRVHLGQYRKQTDEQFVTHPIAVADLLVEADLDGPIVVAAYLHDVVEKTHVEADEIRERFGDRVADVVDALSEDPSLENYGERKRALRRQVLASSRDVVLIYAADRIANLRDWRTVRSSDRPRVATKLGTTLEERLRLWEEDLTELTEYDPQLPFLAEIEIELRALR
jgi:(p)ppGpp synthase/HD superfamily hydrolase